jgi:hypothetical protein
MKSIPSQVTERTTHITIDCHMHKRFDLHGRYTLDRLTFATPQRFVDALASQDGDIKDDK